MPNSKVFVVVGRREGKEEDLVDFFGLDEFLWVDQSRCVSGGCRDGRVLFRGCCLNTCIL